MLSLYLQGFLHMELSNGLRLANQALLLLCLSAPHWVIAQPTAIGAPLEKRIALVIGNNKYPTAPLRNPVNDAMAMAKKLENMSFEVILKTDVSQREMTRAIGEFGTKVSPNSVALFYYAGHGLQARGRNFLVPIDADIATESSVSSEAVDTERVLEQLKPARLSMVVLDACRNNPFERRFRSGSGQGLAQLDAPAGTLIAYATAPGRVALDGEGSHGTYTEALLEAMEVPGLTVEDVFKQVRVRVLKASANQQIPWEASSLTGEFLFRPAVIAEDGVQNKLELEAAATREQLALLNAQMSKLRQTHASTSAIAPANDADRRKVEQEAAGLRQQLASVNVEIEKLRDARAKSADPSKSARGQEKAEPDEVAVRNQIAALNSQIAVLRSTPSASAGILEQPPEWKTQIAKVDKGRGKLTFASAMAGLLAIDEVSSIQALESQITRAERSSAFALGVDASGLFTWGGSYAQPTQAQATEVALDFCAGAGGAKCHAVIVGGKFLEEAWFQTVRQLGTQSIEAVRAAFVRALRQPVMETAAGSSAPGFRNPKGYTISPIRDK